MNWFYFNLGTSWFVLAVIWVFVNHQPAFITFFGVAAMYWVFGILGIGNSKKNKDKKSDKDDD
jgi:hypothetical protein